MALASILLLVLLPPAALAEGARHRPTRHASARHRPLLVPVSVSVDRPGARVPRNFLGLSFELSDLRQIAGYAGGGDLVTLLRSLGPGVLRFAGGTADTRVAWTDAATARPEWARSTIDPGDLRQLGVLASVTGWHIILTIGLGHYEPVAAAREVAAAKAELGESLDAIELGNEPNAFAEHGLRSEPWAFAQYDTEVEAYRVAIEASAPGVPLDGPDVSGSAAFESWGLGEVVDQQPAELTGHHYPLGCEQTPAPSIARLLSPLIYRKEGGSLRRYMAIAEAGRTPFRLDETNTVSCGGQAGISDTFASALWAAGYLPRAMALGVAGVNLHGNPANCNGYAPLCAPTAEALASGTLVAQPEWYALLLAKPLLGGRPLTTSISGREGHNIEVTALLAEDGALQFLIVDDDPPGARSASVSLRVGSAFRAASSLSLSAPSLTSLSGVKLGGRAVAPDGSWSPGPLPVTPDRHGVIRVEIKPSSAALVSTSPTAPS